MARAEGPLVLFDCINDAVSFAQVLAACRLTMWSSDDRYGMILLRMRKISLSEGMDREASVLSDRRTRG